jgi:hypothetical protein
MQATQEAEIRRITVQSQPEQIICDSLSRKTLHRKKQAVEWLKVKALSSSPSTEKKKKTPNRNYVSKYILMKNTKVTIAVVSREGEQIKEWYTKTI